MICSFRDKQRALFFIENERQLEHITDVQAEALQRYLASVYLAEYLQAMLEPFIEKLVGKVQQQLEDRVDDLLI